MKNGAAVHFPDFWGRARDLSHQPQIYLIISDKFEGKIPHKSDAALGAFFWGWVIGYRILGPIPGIP
jgi:hypothetical protein